MSRPDDERWVLDQARRALSPSSDDADRVLRATLAAIAAGAPAPSPSDASSDAGALGRGRSGIGLKLLGALVIAGASGAIGYTEGYRAGRDSAPVEPMMTAASPPIVREHGAASPPLGALVAQTPAAASSPERSQPISRQPKPSLPTAALPSPAEPIAALSVSEELEAVKRVELALRNREPGVALEILDELDRRKPGGMFAEERTAATAMARCGLGLGVRAQLSEEFAATYPASAYLARVQRACESSDE